MFISTPYEYAGIARRTDNRVRLFCLLRVVLSRVCWTLWITSKIGLLTAFFASLSLSLEWKYGVRMEERKDGTKELIPTPHFTSLPITCLKPRFLSQFMKLET